jgi:hypothetical protein
MDPSDTSMANIRNVFDAAVKELLIITRGTKSQGRPTEMANDGRQGQKESEARHDGIGYCDGSIGYSSR